jgi:predicted  nucleic acid-binding Zn-ribbon protein
MTTPYREVVERLRALHDLDAKIQRLDRDLRERPARLAGLEAKVTEMDKKIQLVKDRTLVLRAQIKLRENELRSVEQKIERAKSQAAEVRTNKEFMAYRAELSNYQGDADRIQGEVLKILDVVEQADKRVAEFAEKRERAHLKVIEAQHKVDESLDDVKKERDALLAERPALKKGIPVEPMQAYERVRDSRGIALAVLDGEYCSACMERLTRNDVFAVQNTSRLIVCRGCNRLLVAEL